MDAECDAARSIGDREYRGTVVLTITLLSPRDETAYTALQNAALSASIAARRSVIAPAPVVAECRLLSAEPVRVIVPDPEWEKRLTQLELSFDGKDTQ